MSIPLPPAYDDAGAEYAAVRSAAGVIDRRDHGVLEVTGKDRAAFLHALVSNEVKALAPGQGCAATLLDVHGKVQVMLLVWVFDERILLITPPGMVDVTLEGFDKYLFSEKAYFKDLGAESALLLLAGPQSPAIAQRLTGVVPAETPWSSAAGRFADGDAPLPAHVVRGGGETGESEIWLLVPAAAGERAWQVAVGAGARPVGATALESLRIEAGWPRYGVDVDATVLLPEIPFDRWLSQTKGCYPGQEVVVRIRDRGHVNRHLRGLVLEGEAVPPRGSEIQVDGAPVGTITSATRSLGLQRPVALGFVRRQHAAPGTRVVVKTGDATSPATVSDLPLAR